MSVPARIAPAHSQVVVPEQDTVASALVEGLHRLGVRRAFGVTGGAIAPLFEALGRSSIELLHFRHETGAAFAALEASLAAGEPTAVFATTGPGVMNALTGMMAARWEGGTVVLVSGGTSGPLRGKWACQESSSYTLPPGLYSPGPLFHHALMMEHPAELEEVLARLAAGFARPTGFVSHVGVPTSLLSTRIARSPSPPHLSSANPAPGPEVLQECVELLTSEPAVIWAGYGARHCATELLTLAERIGAPVMCSPRAKGLFPEDHPLYLGLTGLGGHSRVDAWFAAKKPANVLVLGTRLSEPTSYYQPELIPTGRFLHVDLDPEAFGAAYPQATTLGIQSEVGQFLRSLLAHIPETKRPVPSIPPAVEAPVPPARQDRVGAHALMQAIQKVVVDGSDAVVMTESGNAFAWGNNLLRFREPNRYRVSVLYGSMGHMTAGVVGTALARNGKAVAVVGDGSMLMNSEVSTAVRYGAKAVWIVMNDSSYGMVEHGMRALGLQAKETEIPATDFVQVARGMGADGVRVEQASELEDALTRAMAAEGPFVVDVLTDPGEAGPWIKRIQNLIMQGAAQAKEVKR